MLGSSVPRAAPAVAAHRQATVFPLDAEYSRELSTSNAEMDQVSMSALVQQYQPVEFWR
jgi:hypothetical protein